MKGFFITNIENSASYQIGKANVARANDFGNLKAEIFEGVKGSEAYPIFEKEKIKFLDIKYQSELFKERNKEKKYDEQPGQAGCFASHYLLWKKCIDLNETIGIFEYDAKQTRTLPKNIDFESILHLGGWHPIKDQDDATLINGTRGLHEYLGYNRWGFKNVMIGLYAYLLKPNAAKILVKTAKTKGWFPADRFMSTDIIQMKKQTYSPFLFTAVPIMSLTGNYNV
jgi:glycosyl transferase family 25